MKWDFFIKVAKIAFYIFMSIKIYIDFEMDLKKSMKI
jgi:hypothetical protein